MESEPGDGNLSHTSNGGKRFLPGLHVNLDAARKSDWVRDPGLKRSMLHLDTNNVLHDVTGNRGMSRDVDTANSRTRKEPVPRPDRNFPIRRCRVKHPPHSYTRRHEVTLPSLEALRVERRKGRELDRLLASIKRNLKPVNKSQKSDIRVAPINFSRRSTKISERGENLNSLTPFKWTLELKNNQTISTTEDKTKRDSSLCEMYPESVPNKLWKKAIGKVLTVVRLGNHMAQWSLMLERRALPTFTDMDDLEYRKLYHTLFPKERIENEVMKKYVLSKTAQMIMSLSPQKRTQEDCEMVGRSLQTIAEFRSLPLHIRKDIVSHGHLMVIKNKRILIRHGHEAMNWYFVVCGQGLARSNVMASTQTRTVTILSQGMSFGEIAIKCQIPRTCTVMSRTPMQLIYLTKSDYLKIFQETQEVFPEHIKFIRNLNFMKHWPIEHLLKHPTQCTQRYYRRNELIVKNSNSSKFLYIVCSGACAVYISVPQTSSSWRDLQLKLIHPMINIEGWPEASTDTGNICQHGGSCLRQSGGSCLRQSRGGCLRQSGGSYLRFKRPSSFSTVSTHLDLDSMSCLQLHDPDYCQQLSSARPSRPSAAWENDWPFDLLPNSSDDKMTATGKRSGYGEEKKKERVTEEMEEGRISSYFDQAADHAINLPSQTADGNKKVYSQVPRKLSPPKRSKTTSTSSGKRKSTRYSVSGGCVYLQIDTLRVGDVFGLNELDLPDMKQSVLAGKPCLVSLGAEVIALSKKFYMSHCNILCQEEVFKSRCFYPSQKKMHICYRMHLAWEQYAKRVVDELKDDILQKGYKFFGLYFPNRELNLDTTLSKTDCTQRRSTDAYIRSLEQREALDDE